MVKSPHAPSYDSTLHGRDFLQTVCHAELPRLLGMYRGTRQCVQRSTNTLAEQVQAGSVNAHKFPNKSWCCWVFALCFYLLSAGYQAA